MGASKIGLDKFVAPALWRLDNRRVPVLGLRLHPRLKLFGGGAQHIAADRIDLPVTAEKADHPLRLLKRLDQAVEQDPVETAIAEPDAVFVVFVKRIHRRLRYSPSRQHNPAVSANTVDQYGISRAKPLAS